MARNKKFDKLKRAAGSGKSRGKSSIPEAATELRRSSEELTPFFSFEHLCENSFYLYLLGSQELKELHNFLKKSSTMQWKQVRRSFEYKVIPRYGLSCSVPDTVPDDAKIAELRVTQEHRIFGFKVDEVFYVIWFDPTHDVCPEGKRKR